MKTLNFGIFLFNNICCKIKLKVYNIFKDNKKLNYEFLNLSYYLRNYFLVGYLLTSNIQ